MKPDISAYLTELTEMVAKLGGEHEHFAKLDSLFDDLETEIGYLDQKRDEAESNLHAFILALQTKEKTDSENL